MSDRREYQRFDINTVLEFKPFSELTRAFFGVTKNFSAQGVCLETHHTDIKPGDEIEFRLNHPQESETLSVPGSVVWKRSAPQFTHALGIQLHDMELDTKVKMLETMSAAGSIPVDAFYTDEPVSGEKDDAYSTEPSEPETVVVPGAEDRGQPVLNAADNQAETDETEDIRTTWRRAMKMGDAQGPFERLSSSADILKRSLSGVTPAGVSWQELKERAGAVTPERAWKNLSAAGSRIAENRYVPHLMIAAVFLAILVYLTGLMFGSKSETFVAEPEVQKEAASAPAPEPEKEQANLSIKEELSGDIRVIDEPLLVKPEITKKITPESVSRVKPKIDRRSPVSGVRAGSSSPYYIQVGVWGNADNAKKILDRLRIRYDNAYIKAEGHLNRVVIPDIQSRKEAAPILKDLESRYRIKALLKARDS